MINILTKIILCIFFFTLDFAIVKADEYSKLYWEARVSGINGNAYAITEDDSYVYAVGSNFIPGSTNLQWRVEKRNKSDGNLAWVQTVDFAEAHAITQDSSYIYVAGISANGGGQNQWRIEKRNKSDGSLVWVQNSLVFNVGQKAYGIAQDTSYLYIVGYDCYNYKQGWRIEKRNKSDGSLVWAQNPKRLGGDDEARSVVEDSSYVYVAGYSLASSFDSEWRVEKRNKSDGSLVWAQTSNPSPGSDFAYSIIQDTSYVYVCGFESVSGNFDWQWRIEKRNKSDGSLVWTQINNPSSGRDYPNSIAQDNNYFYIVGIDGYQCRNEKRNKTDGSLVWVKTGWEYLGNAVTTDDPYLYVAGGGYKIQKRSKFTDVGLRVYDGSSIINIACDKNADLPLRIQKNDATYGVNLVDPSNSTASKIRIKTSEGIKALRKL